jgi:alpha-L-fucosidase
MHDSSYPSQTYQYHEATYGADFNYDDFFSNFTASKFNARTWVDLVAASGAQYIVPVTSWFFCNAWLISMLITSRTS